MRTLLVTLLLALFTHFSYSQSSTEVSQKRNVYNKKGDYYFSRNECKKAILYFNLSYQMDSTDYLSVLKKAEAYNKLKLFAQAEESYRIAFESPQQPANAFKLKYALVLLNNNKPDEFKYWLKMYNEVVEVELSQENYLVSNEKRVQLYKDTSLVIVSDDSKIDTIKFKIKYAGYQYKSKSTAEDNQLYVLLSNGDEHYISAAESDDFNFSFQPMDDYKMVIQQEDILANAILMDKKLSANQRKKYFMKPPPLQKDELPLQKGMTYQFSSGKYQISPQYLNTINELSKSYLSETENAVDLTAIVKEMQLSDGGIYTIRFIKETDPTKTYTKSEISTITLNESNIPVYGYSFLLVLPDRVKENFAIQTDIEALKKNFNSKKYALKVDNSPLFKTEQNPASPLLSLTVNTKKTSEVSAQNNLSAQEISFIPGTEYLLSLSKPSNEPGKEIEIIVPLTKGVRYNLTAAPKTEIEFKNNLTKFLTEKNNAQPVDEEIIDISLLSKELEIKSGEQLTFSLLPIKQLVKKETTTEETISNLTVDGKVFEISKVEKYTINVPFPENNKVSFQTDMKYLQENFNAEACNIRLDTVSFTAEIAVDTTNYNKIKSTGWLSVSVNTNTTSEVAIQDQFMAKELSIIPGQEYILTVTRIDAKTGKSDEIIIPLIRQVKYDFTSNPTAEEDYKESLDNFIKGRENIETTEGTLIDITLLSKELNISENDKVSFSLQPVKKLKKEITPAPMEKSSLLLDNKMVEFNDAHKYAVNIPLNEDNQVNMQTDLQYIQEYFDPSSINLNIDTLSFFSEITVDTTGMGDRIIKVENEITDPVFDMLILYFDVNAFSLNTASTNEVSSKVIDVLKKDSRLYVTIKGFTDPLGDAAYNLNLSKKRAESVKEYLSKYGIGESRIRTFSFGESEALSKDMDKNALSEEELKKFRKVEIVIYLPK